ncbi:MAG: peptide ABC transporter permease [Methanobrevibacter sp.]|nr:peptide ABC transporter permease [Methanobrevibacter sp.]
MLDLIFGYLLITTILFSANIGLFSANFKFNNIKSSLLFLVLGILFIIDISVAGIFSINLLDYLTYIFLIISIIIYIILVIYLKLDKFDVSITVTVILFYVSSFLLASQLNQSSIFYGLLLTLISIIIMILAFQSSKLLMYAKRPYNMIIGEYMSLMGILIFLFGLTNISIMQLDYEMFSSFLILTPTYQLIYVVIAIVMILIVGLYWNDKNN